MTSYSRQTRITSSLSRGAALAMAILGLTTALALAQEPVSPARPAPAAQPAPPAKPAPAVRPAPAARPLPSRSVKIEVSVVPAAGAVAGTPRVLSVTTAEGRNAKVRRQGQPGNVFFSLDATATVVNDRQVLVDFNLNANASEQDDAKVLVGIAQEGWVLLTPGVKQRITQLDDSGGRANLHVEMLVEILK